MHTFEYDTVKDKYICTTCGYEISAIEYCNRDIEDDTTDVWGD